MERKCGFIQINPHFPFLKKVRTNNLILRYFYTRFCLYSIGAWIARLMFSQSFGRGIYNKEDMLVYRVWLEFTVKNDCE